MIAFIRGTVAFKNAESLILDNQGIGYEVRVSRRDYESVERGEEILLHTHMQIREDDISLFGFSDPRDLRVFSSLLTVKGIGPKAALSILSTLTADALTVAVFSEDVRAIAKAPGIGPKSAKRLIMELKDHLDIGEISGAEELPGVQTAFTDRRETEDAILALEALGYTSSEAWRAVTSIPDADSMDTQQLLKESLKYL